MNSYPTIEGTSVSETWTANVNRSNGTTYSETFTHRASVPVSQQIQMNDESKVVSWKWPTLDKASFKKLKESGAIKMSDYDVGQESITNFVVRIPRCNETFIKRGAYTLTEDSKSFLNRDTHLFNLRAPYNIVGDYDHLRVVFPTAPVYSLDRDYNEDIAALVASAMEEVVGELNSSYDPLTDLAELRESLETIHSLLRSALHPLQTIRDLFVNKKGRLSLVGGWTQRWMEFRYGIMPIIYSIQDVMKTMRQIKLVYHTERAFRPLTKSKDSSVGMGSQFYQKVQFTGIIRATGKSKPPESEFLRLLDSLSFNPLKTAWELIPMSFVVDWFVNVGDYIEALSGALFTFADDRKFCYSTQITSVRTTYFRDFHDDRRTLITGPWYVNPPNANVFDRISRAGGQLYNADYVLKTENLKSYSRRVFLPSDIELRLDVYLNWKRWVDSFVIGLGKTKSLLRSIR